MRSQRPRAASIVGLALVIFLGLVSRRSAQALPPFVALYAGDTLWALAAFLGFGLILPWASTWRVALLALAFSVAVELSQLWKPPWLVTIRGTTLGGLVLGFDFVWSDLACYAVGVLLGVLIERAADSLRPAPRA